MFNSEQLKGLLERGVYLGLLWLVGKGIIPADWVGDLTLAIITLAGLFLGWKQNTAPALAKATAALPEVKEVVVKRDSGIDTSSSPDAKITT